MSPEEKYEELKANVIRSHNDYLKVIHDSKFKDLKLLKNRLLIFDSHIPALKADVEFREMIIDYIREVDFLS